MEDAVSIKTGKSVGQSATYEIADRQLFLKPLALGRMKKATMVFTEKSDDNLETIAKYLLAVLDNGQNKDLTLEWIQDNVTLPQAQEIIEDSRIINGLGSFFQKGAQPDQPMQERPLQEQTPATPTPSV